MERIESYGQLGGMINARMKRGMVTNAFLSREAWEREISRGAVMYCPADEGLFVLRARPTHMIMSFWINEGFSGCDEMPSGTVCEIPMRAGDGRTEGAVNALISSGFAHEFTRTRMASAEKNGVVCGSIRTASEGDFELCRRLLYENFSPLTGCIPDDEQLMGDISHGGVLIYGGGTGLLHHRTDEKKTELRHLCVSEAERGQGIAAKLVLAYHSVTEGMRRLVWVREDCAPAVKTYEKCGYAADGMISRVLIRR